VASRINSQPEIQCIYRKQKVSGKLSSVPIGSTLKMEAICSSETSVATQQITRRHSQKMILLLILNCYPASCDSVERGRKGQHSLRKKKSRIKWEHVHSKRVPQLARTWEAQKSKFKAGTRAAYVYVVRSALTPKWLTLHPSSRRAWYRKRRDTKNWSWKEQIRPSDYITLWAGGQVSRTRILVGRNNLLSMLRNKK
jgi:hypothetical protein